MAVRIRWGDRELELPEGRTLEALVRDHGGIGEGMAVFLNGRRIPRGDWPATPVRDGDAIEVAELIAGG